MSETESNFGERVRFTMSDDPLRDHLCKVCEPDCAYCAKHRRIQAEERLPLLEAVAHAAWHVPDDSGETDDDALRIVSALQADRLSDALDALEAHGWNAHPEEAGERA